MRTIFRIARHELRQLFYSPLAWVVIVGFYLVAVLYYFSVEGRLGTLFQRGGYDLIRLEFLTAQVLSPLIRSSSLDNPTLISYLTMFLPLVTMGVFAREFRSGTYKLLFSSPISTGQLVLGKFLGLMGFNLVPVGLLGVVLGLAGLSITNADWMLLCSALAATYLLVMLYAAIGLYFSSLTSYPLVAAVLTFFFGLFIGFASGLVELLGKQLGPYSIGFVRSFGYISDYLRIGEMGNIAHGIVHSRELIHFLNFTVVFVALTVLHLNARRQRITLRKKVGIYAALFGAAIAVAYVSTRPQLIFVKDVSREKLFSIHPTTKQLLEAMDDGPLEVTYYINQLDMYSFVFHPFKQYLFDNRWEKYRVVKPDIHLRFVYYYDKRGAEPRTLAKHEGKSERELGEFFAANARFSSLPFELFLSPAQMEQQVDLSFEMYRNVVQLNYRGKTQFLRHFPTSENSGGIYSFQETEVAPALQRLTGSQPRVFFSTGHAELDPEGRGPRGLKKLLNLPIYRYSLINQGLDSDTINFADRALPDTARLLAICDPRFPLPEAYLTRFEEYLAAGKNLLLMVEPDKREITAPLLERLGLRARSGVLGNSNEKRTGEQVNAYLAYPAKDFSKSMRQFIEKEMFYRSDSVWLTFNGAVALEQTHDVGFRAEPFLVLDTADGFNRPSATQQSDMEGRLWKQADDEVAPFHLGYKLTRQVNGEEQRIVVVGDADVNSTLFDRFPAPVFGWLTDSGFPVDLVKPEPLDRTFSFEPGTIRSRKMIWMYGATGILALIASVVLIRRNRN